MTDFSGPANNFKKSFGRDGSLVKAIAEYVIADIQPDGSWRISWSWNNYEKEWAVSEIWWKGYAAVVNLIF